MNNPVRVHVTYYPPGILWMLHVSTVLVGGECMRGGLPACLAGLPLLPGMWSHVSYCTSSFITYISMYIYSICATGAIIIKWIDDHCVEYNCKFTQNTPWKMNNKVRWSSSIWMYSENNFLLYNMYLIECAPMFVNPCSTKEGGMQSGRR